MAPTPNDHWTLDRKVPVAIIATLIVQLVGFAWYAAKLDSRVEEQALRLARTEAQILTIDRDARDFGTRIVRIEEKSSAMLTLLQQIEQRLERALTPPRRSDIP